MSTSYHTQERVSTQTRVPVPEIDLARVHKTLRATLATIVALTRKHGYCYATLTYIGNSNARSRTTAQRHVRLLIAAGIIRRESAPGFTDLLFICPMSEWNLPSIRPENGRGLIQINDPGIDSFEMKRTNTDLPKTRTERKRADVVVSSQEKREKTTVQSAPLVEPQIAEEELFTEEDRTSLIAALDDLSEPEVISLPDTDPSPTAPLVEPEPAAAPPPTLDEERCVSPGLALTREIVSQVDVSWEVVALAVEEDPDRARAAAAAMAQYAQTHKIEAGNAFYRAAFAKAYKPNAVAPPKPQPKPKPVAITPEEAEALGRKRRGLPPLDPPQDMSAARGGALAMARAALRGVKKNEPAAEP